MINRISVLDGLRGFASLLVLWAHFPVITDFSIFTYSKMAANGTYAGYVGVDIFFALSGFLITRILLAEKRTGGIDFKKFYIKRSLRIFPVYYLAILLVGVFISWDKTIWSALYLSNYYFSFDKAANALRHVWSLCVEEHYYLFWPLVMSYFKIERSEIIIKYIIPAVAIVSAIIFLAYSEDGIALVTKASNVRILTLCFGSILAYKESEIRRLATKNIFIACISLFFLVCACHFFSNVMLMVFFRYLLSSIFSTVFLIAILNAAFKQNKPRLLYVFDNMFFRFFGKISYGLYLFHQPILFYFGVSHMDSGKGVSLGFGMYLLAICIICPVFIYYSFEKPFLKLKDKLVLVKVRNV